MQPFTALFKIRPVKTVPEKEVFSQVLLQLIHFVALTTVELAGFVFFFFIWRQLNSMGCCIKVRKNVYHPHGAQGSLTMSELC